jgi:hypothetical protein
VLSTTTPLLVQAPVLVPRRAQMRGQLSLKAMKTGSRAQTAPGQRHTERGSVHWRGACEGSQRVDPRLRVAAGRG